MPNRSERPAKERSSYRLPQDLASARLGRYLARCLARSGFMASAASLRRGEGGSLLNRLRDSGLEASPRPGMTGRNEGDLSPRALADGLEFHGTVGDYDPEGGAQG